MGKSTQPHSSNKLTSNVEECEIMSFRNKKTKNVAILHYSLTYQDSSNYLGLHLGSHYCSENIFSFKRKTE